MMPPEYLTEHLAAREQICRILHPRFDGETLAEYGVEAMERCVVDKCHLLCYIHDSGTTWDVFVSRDSGCRDKSEMAIGPI